MRTPNPPLTTNLRGDPPGPNNTEGPREDWREAGEVKLKACQKKQKNKKNKTKQKQTKTKKQKQKQTKKKVESLPVLSSSLILQIRKGEGVGLI